MYERVDVEFKKSIILSLTKTKLLAARDTVLNLSLTNSIRISKQIKNELAIDEIKFRYLLKENTAKHGC